MDAILNSTREGIVAADEAGRILFVNSQAEQMVGPVQDMKPGELYDASQRQRRHGLFSPDGEAYLPTDRLPLVRALRGEATDDMDVFIRNEFNPEGMHAAVSGRTLWRDDHHQEIDGGLVFFRDVTKEKTVEVDLRQTLRELRDQTQLMQTVFDNMEEGVVIVDSETGDYLLVNRRRDEIVGSQLIASSPEKWSMDFGVFHLDQETHFPASELPLARAMKGETTEEVELFLRNEHRPEGAYIRVRGRPLLDGNQKVVAGVAIFSDITKYKQTERELARTVHDLENQAHLMETVFESISDGVVVTNAEGQFTFVNSSATRIVGVHTPTASSDEWADAYGVFRLDGQTPFPVHEMPLMRAMHGETTDDVEMFIRNQERPEGIFVSVNGRPLQKNMKGHAGGVVTFRDVTSRKLADLELKRTLQELRDQTELMEAAFNGISEGIAVTDTAANLIRLNPACRRLVDYDLMDPSEQQRLIKWGMYYYPDRETLIPPEDLPLNRVVFHGETINELDMFVRTRFKSEGIFIRLNAQPLLRADNSIRGSVILIRDVTDQIRAEEALVRAFAQGRLEMIDTILHNIGNAISSVTTGIDTLHLYLTNNPFIPRLRALADAVKAHQDDWADYVAHDPQGQKVRPFIIALAEDLTKQHDEMGRAARRVKDRAHHIADIIRTQKALDSTHMVRVDLDLEKALLAAIRVLHDSLDNRGIKVETHCGNAPRVIRIQENRFHQMLINLIKNAMEAIDDLAAASGLEHAPCIRIRAYEEGDFLHLDVTDNGIGIDSENSKILFAAGYTTKRSGSGLGLHSAANFVTGMGGQIRALSDGVGKGTTLRIMLRLDGISPPPPPPPPPPEPSRIRPRRD